LKPDREITMNAEPKPRAEALLVDPAKPARAASLVPRAGASTPARMIEYAMTQGADMDQLERLFELQKQYEANEARKAYHLALADFKAEPLTISKDKRVFFPSKDGSGATDYMHATLGGVVKVIAPALAKHRLSHSWDVQREGERIRVVCKLTHALGHSESISLEGPLDASGKKNAIQQQASTITYLERYTLLAITGLATEDQLDDDGGAGGEGGGETYDAISEEQEAALRDTLFEAGADLPKFLAYFRIETLADMPLTDFEAAQRLANQKLAAAKKKG
jgi:hypothetical protein